MTRSGFSQKYSRIVVDARTLRANNAQCFLRPPYFQPVGSTAEIHSCEVRSAPIKDALGLAGARHYWVLIDARNGSLRVKSGFCSEVSAAGKLEVKSDTTTMPWGLAAGFIVPIDDKVSFRVRGNRPANVAGVQGRRDRRLRLMPLVVRNHSYVVCAR
jgi:hypothetical protein